MIIKTTVNGKSMLKVVRPERLKVLRVHLMGLTIAFTAVLAYWIFAASPRTPALSLLYFVIGYFTGAFFCSSYNLFAYLYLKLIHPEWLKLWFWYDPGEVVNIIKTPLPEKDWKIRYPTTYALHEEMLRKNEARVFNFRPYDNVVHNGKRMQRPYTIVFVANPFIRLRKMDKGHIMAQRDPVMDNVGLFLKTVYRALFSFEFNEVIGRPDIFSKIRVVTVNESAALRTAAEGPVIFDTVKDQCYVSEFLGTFEADPNRSDPRFDNSSDIRAFTDRMLVPNLEMRQKIRTLIRDETGIEHIDVIFAVSASFTHDMSTAKVASNDSNEDGQPYTISTDPFCEKGAQILKNDCEQKLCAGYHKPDPTSDGTCLKSHKLHRSNGPDRVMIHEYFADPDGMGLVALSAYDVRAKLPVHEFAHAMSSEHHGTVVDEYYDFVRLKEAAEAIKPPPEELGPNDLVPQPDNAVNRIYRNPQLMSETHEVPVHNHFARYNWHVYESDRDHHIAQQGWYSYFPDRKNPEVRCTMEAAEDVFQFDELLSDFIYDRLWVKVNRDFLIP